MAFGLLMRPLLFLSLLNKHVAVGVNHSLTYYYAASYGGTNIPEFVPLQMVDDVQISYWDSITNENVPKHEWMNCFTEEGPRYWKHQTDVCVAQQWWFKYNAETIKTRMNQTEGVTTLQYMYGCHWDDQTGEIYGYRKFGYDGEDFLVWDMETNSWLDAHQKALEIKIRLDHDTAELEHTKRYLTQECPEYLKKYVNCGRSSLMRTVPPSVSLLQKSSSSPITCHATGFYPSRAEMFWRRDEEELHEAVVKGEILPNNDATFQMSVDLDLSSVPAEDWRSYECVFQLSGVNEDIITKLDKAAIRTNEASAADLSTIIIIISTAAAVLVLFFVGIIGFIIYRIKFDKTTSSVYGPPRTRSSSDESYQ